MPLFSGRRRQRHEFRQGWSIASILGAPFRSLARLLAGRERGIGQDKPLPAVILGGIIRLLLAPFMAIYHVGQFIIMSWAMTRSFPALIPGLIPLAVGSVVVGIVIVYPFIEERAARGRHAKFLADSEQAGDFDRALLGSRRIQKISNETNMKILHARTLHNAGKTDNAIAVMSSLAQFRKDDMAEAHLYLAEQDLRKYQEEGAVDRSLLEDAEKHLDHYVQLHPVAEGSHRAAHLLRGRVWMLLGKEDQAMAFFETVSGVDPSVVPDLVKYLMARNRPEDARLAVERGFKTLVALAKSNPENPVIWETMYQVLVSGDQYQQAIEAFENAYKEVENPMVRQQLRELQSKVLMDFYRKLPDSQNLDVLQRRVMITTEAIKAFPRNPDALQEFTRYTLYHENPEFRDWVEKLGVDPNYPPFLHHLRTGARYALDGKPDNSRKHFELAVLADGVPAVVLTDIARLLASNEGKAGDALKIIDAASGTWKTPLLNAARGEILMTMDRYDEALEELEYAASEHGDDPQIWRLLAACRDHHGDAKGAEEALSRAEEAQQRLIDAIKKSQQPPTPRA